VRGDQGGRALFDRFPPRLVEWGASASVDIDSVEDLRRLEPDQDHHAG
jgi:CTP:molybdopterin cytidylyltransferase MocA